MNMNQCDIGLIGLAVMGENLALNLESKGFSVAVFNRTTKVTEKFAAGRGKGKNIRPTRTMEEFVAALKKPRIAMMMVKAGAPVDAVIGQLAPLLVAARVVSQQLAHGVHVQRLGQDFGRPRVELPVEPVIKPRHGLSE